MNQDTRTRESWVARSAGKVARIDRFLVLVCILFLAKGMVWVAIVPPWQGPDEPDHFAYVENVVNEGGFRPRHRPMSRALQTSIIRTGASEIFNQGRIRSDLTGPEAAKAIEEINAQSRTEPVEQASRAGGYPPLYYWALASVLEVWDGTNYLDGLYIARGVSVALAMVGLIFQFFTFKLIFRDQLVTRSATLVAALLPMLTYLNAVVNPDVMVTTLGSAVLYFFVRGVQQGFGLKTHAAIGLTLGAGLLTKQSFAIFALAYGGLATVEFVRRGRSRLLVAKNAGIAIATSVVLAGWLYLPLHALAGTGARPGLSVPQYFQWVFSERARSVIHEWWGVFGWLDAPMSSQTFRILDIVTLLCLAGLVVALIRVRLRAELLWMLIATIVLWTAVLGMLEYPRVRDGLDLSGFIQGRYFMPLTSGIVALGVAGLLGLNQTNTWRRTVASLMVVGVTVLHVIALLGVVIPRYYV